MTQRRLTLNCDMGESFGSWTKGQDDKVMPLIDMANIACGFHASDPVTMANTVKLAVRHQVSVGAHPSYPDLVGFGRRSMALSAEEITYSVIYQVGALKAVCESFNHSVDYIKPHGALYNDMMADVAVFESIVDAAASFNLPVMMLAQQNNSDYFDIAERYDVPLLFEAFADRAYLVDGSLAPREQAGSVLTRQEDIIGQVLQIVNYGKVRTIDGYTLDIEADTICVHGDNPAALQTLIELKQQLGRG